MVFPYRLLGFFLILCGLSCGFLGIYLPISEAMRNAYQVSVFYKAVFLFPLFIGFGLIYFIFGLNATWVIGERDYPTIFGWVFIISLIICGFLANHCVSLYISSLGYSH
jgi:hypothetical protein